MKGRVGPIADTIDKTVFHWVDVAIFDVAAIVVIVSDQVFLETPLPDAPFTARPTNFA